jgi:hypothetical protein
VPRVIGPIRGRAEHRSGRVFPFPDLAPSPIFTTYPQGRYGGRSTPAVAALSAGGIRDNNRHNAPARHPADEPPSRNRHIPSTCRSRASGAHSAASPRSRNRSGSLPSRARGPAAAHRLVRATNPLTAPLPSLFCCCSGPGKQPPWVVRNVGSSAAGSQLSPPLAERRGGEPVSFEWSCSAWPVLFRAFQDIAEGER